jgi:hypothetical protein
MNVGRRCLLKDEPLARFADDSCAMLDISSVMVLLIENTSHNEASKSGQTMSPVDRCDSLDRLVTMPP